MMKIIQTTYKQSPTPPSSAKSETPKTVSDKKRFFEHVMEDQQKPTPKSGKKHLRQHEKYFPLFLLLFSVLSFVFFLLKIGIQAKK